VIRRRRRVFRRGSAAEVERGGPRPGGPHRLRPLMAIKVMMREVAFDVFGFDDSGICMGIPLLSRGVGKGERGDMPPGNSHAEKFLGFG